jgi:hypothetical protein
MVGWTTVGQCVAIINWAVVAIAGIAIVGSFLTLIVFLKRR